MKRKLQPIAWLLALVCLLGAGCDKKAENPTEAPAVYGDRDWVWASNENGAFSEDGYYYLSAGGFLHFLDIEGGLSVCLCSKTACLHEKEEDVFKQEECEAKLSGFTSLTPVFYWKDGLFYVLSDAYGTHLYRRNADGSGLSKVSTLGARYAQEKKDVELFSFAVAAGCLYYDAEVKGIIRDETGAGIVQRELCYIGRVDLQTGKDEVLCSDAENFLALYAAAEDAALVFSYGEPDLAYEDPGYREAVLEEPCRLLCWNGTDGKLTQVFEKTLRKCQTVTMVDRGMLFYKSSGEEGGATYSYDLRTGKEALVSSAALRHIHGRFALQMGKDGTWQLREVPSGRLLPIELGNDFLSVGAVSEKGFILERGLKEDNSNRITARVFCYVTYEALEDGLQEADLTPFYRRENTRY